MFRGAETHTLINASHSQKSDVLGLDSKPTAPTTQAWDPQNLTSSSMWMSSLLTFPPTLLDCLFITIYRISRYIMDTNPLSDNWLKTLSELCLYLLINRGATFVFFILHDWFLFLTSLPPEAGRMFSCTFFYPIPVGIILILYFLSYL